MTGGISGFFFSKASPPPPRHREDSGYSSESPDTQFLVFLLPPGLSRLRTVSGTKQKQMGGWGGTPQTPERGQGVAKRGVIFLGLFQENKESTINSVQKHGGRVTATPEPAP